jgi:hypothetical protein
VRLWTIISSRAATIFRGAFPAAFLNASATRHPPPTILHYITPFIYLFKKINKEIKK